MDPRAHTSFNQATFIRPEKVADFFVNPEAFAAFLETLDVANSNSPNAALAMRQRKAQQEMLDAVPVRNAPTAEELAIQYKPFTLLPVYQPMAVQQHGGALTLTAEQRAANEEIRQRQYTAQVAMLAAARLTP